MANSELSARGFIKKLVGFSMASWISAAISFLVTPIFTRLYLPEEIGHINLFTTYMTFFQTICVLALDQAFMRFYNEDLSGIQKNNFLTFCLKINLSIALAANLVILLGHRFFSAQIAGEDTCLIPICLGIVVVCSTFLRMSSISSRMEKNIVQYTLQVLLITFVEKVIFTIIAFYRPSYRVAILSMTVGYGILSLVFFFIKRKRALLPVKSVPKQTLATILKFAIPYLPVLLLAWLNSSIPMLVLKKYVDYSSIGIYTNAVTIANILTIIQTGFSAYWGPFIYEHYKNNSDKVKIQRIEKVILLVLIFAAIGIVLFQDIIYYLVGEKFRASKVFFPFLMFTPICNCIADMTGVGIMLSKKSYLNIFTFLGSTCTNLLLSYLLVPRIGIMGAGIAVCASSLVMLTIRSYIGGKYYKICDNNWFVIAGIALMLCACVANALFAQEFVIRCVVVLSLLFVLLSLFHKEVSYLAKLIIREIKSILHRR